MKRILGMKWTAVLICVIFAFFASVLGARTVGADNTVPGCYCARGTCSTPAVPKPTFTCTGDLLSAPCVGCTNNSASWDDGITRNCDGTHVSDKGCCVAKDCDQCVNECVHWCWKPVTPCVAVISGPCTNARCEYTLGTCAV
jgi:hypothetical protein